MEEEERTAEKRRQAGPTRPLGRGLEDVSHLFLSKVTEEEEGVEVPRSRVEPLTLVGPGDRLAREQLASFLWSQTAALEPGLTAIDAHVSCGNCGIMDILAVDSASQLAVVDLEPGPTDVLLLRGLSHIDWIERNTPNVRRMYRGRAINFSLQPRLFLVAPHFSPLVKSAARRFASPQIAWRKYHLVVLPGGMGIFFEDATAE